MTLIPAEARLTAGRYVPFVHSVFVEGLDLSAATFKGQLRDRWNGGAIRADLATVGSASAEGIRFVALTWLNGRPVSELGIRINKSTMVAVPVDQADPEAAVALVFDIHVERTATMPEVLLRADFIVQEGSTQ